jgi:hypothetical protein
MILVAIEFSEKINPCPGTLVCITNFERSCKKVEKQMNQIFTFVFINFVKHN